MDRERERRGQLRLGPDLEPVLVAVARGHEPFHDAPLLVHLHREDAAMPRGIAVFRDGTAECLVQFLDLRIQYLREAQEEWR